MTDDRKQANMSDRPEEGKPEQADQQTRQSQANAVAQPGQNAVPGRRPLFRS